MRTFLIILGIVSVISIGLFLKHKGIIFSDGIPGKTKTLDKTKWLKTLPGKWELNESYNNAEKHLRIEGRIQFFENQEFKLNASANFYDRTNHVISTYSGYTRGNWCVTDSAIQLYNLADCKIDLSFKKFHDSPLFKGCQYFEGIKYGNIDTDTQTEIIKISKNEIQIKGKTYKDDSKYTCTLTRL